MVFEACDSILRRYGLTKLILEKVAEEEGQGKGKLLYHFPNKASLIEDLFE